MVSSSKKQITCELCDCLDNCAKSNTAITWSILMMIMLLIFSDVKSMDSVMMMKHPKVGEELYD